MRIAARRAVGQAWSRPDQRDCRVAAGVHSLAVCDEGEGLPAGFEPAAVDKSLGMRVANALTGQLRGKLTAGAGSGGKGARFSVAFAGIAWAGADQSVIEPFARGAPVS